MRYLNIVGHCHSEFPPIGWPACPIQLVLLFSCSSESDRTVLDQGTHRLMMFILQKEYLLYFKNILNSNMKFDKRTRKRYNVSIGFYNYWLCFVVLIIENGVFDLGLF